MKKTELCNSTYKDLLAQFTAHLQSVNYAKGTVKSGVNSAKDYLLYLENRDLNFNTASTKEIQEYFDFLQERTNKNTGLGLSMSYLQKIKFGLILFYDFLHLTQEVYTEQGRSENYPKPIFPQIKKGNFVPKVLTKEEIEKLFKACDQTLLGKRNKALLSIYYGCGLRRQEGTALNIEDIDFNKGLIFITKSKTHRQRNVPMSANMQGILEDYLYNVREKLIDKSESQSAVLVTERGNRLSVESVMYILSKLLVEAKITTKASPHTLRHSIATHLLKSGMKLESIALFLGHRSLDSTQIYTHLSKS